MCLWNRVAWTDLASSWAIAITVCRSSRVRSWRSGRRTSQFHILACSSTCRWGRSRHGSGKIISVCVNCRGTTNSMVAEPFKFVKVHHFVMRTVMKFYFHNLMNGDTRWCSQLRHRTTSPKVAGLIPNGVAGIFLWHNSSGRTMALGLTQPLTEMRTRNISWG